MADQEHGAGLRAWQRMAIVFMGELGPPLEAVARRNCIALNDCDAIEAALVRESQSAEREAALVAAAHRACAELIFKRLGLCELNDLVLSLTPADAQAALDAMLAEALKEERIAGQEREVALVAAAVSICRYRREKPIPPTVLGPHGEIKGEYHMAGQEQAALDLARQIGRLTSDDASMLRAALDKYDPAHASVSVAPTIEELIARSSLGTPEAKAIRAQADPADVARVMARVDELDEEDDGGDFEADQCGAVGDPRDPKTQVCVLEPGHDGPHRAIYVDTVKIVE
jgi:hypothetical protein